tara:strand:+ start:89 stop:556 length:468 start_codon:yes stop_codon:yes gene_type:complete
MTMLFQEKYKQNGMHTYLTRIGGNRIIGIGFFVEKRFYSSLTYSQERPMKKVLELITQFREVLLLINGNLIPCNYDVSNNTADYDGEEFHCVIWYKNGDNGTIVESPNETYMTSQALEDQWKAHLLIKAELADLKASMKSPVVAESVDDAVVTDD